MKEFKVTQSITPRESLNISCYFANISSTRPLDADQEADLATRIRRGDLKARDELVTANLRFVVSVAKQYQNLGVPLDDLISEGNIGLIKAAERFDPTRGFKFATFAVWWIRQAILSFLVDKSRMVRLPMNVANILSRIRTASNAFEQEHQRTPSEDELAQILNMDVEKVKEYLGHISSTTSLDAPLSSDTETTVCETIADTSVATSDESLIYESLRHDIDVALDSVSSKEQRIIRLYYGLDGEQYSLDTIAEEFHLSRERIRQLAEHGIDTIRRIHGKDLRRYA